ncbi:hypothetical protein KA977_08785 [Candidatus Dependentiae bacterium]|nr:hypothetical protein [Candidatus Dependentiae bacterium]
MDYYLEKKYGYVLLILMGFVLNCIGLNAADISWFDSGDTFFYNTVKKTEIISDQNGDTLYYNIEYYKSGDFLRIERYAFREKVETFILHIGNDYHVWRKNSDGKTISQFQKKDDPDKYKYNSQILNYSENIFNDYFGSETANLDELKFEITGDTKGMFDGLNEEVYHLSSKLIDISGANMYINEHWLTKKRMVIKEISRHYVKSIGLDFILKSISVKTNEFDCILPENLNKIY